jgi:hypothetical protein
MSLNPSFTIGNNASIQSQFLVTDTSTGSDPAITNRLLFINLVDNSTFTGAPIQFPLSAGTTITPSILTSDFAFAATMQWVGSSGNVLYQVVGQLGVFTGFLENFEYNLCQQIAAQANLLNDVNFFNNWSKLRTLIDAANNAITIGSSIYNSQSMILLGQFIVNNQANNF